jgi:hypothetical protein
MAIDWSPLFIKYLVDDDMNGRVITTYPRSDYMSFLNTIPPPNLHDFVQPGSIKFGASISFKEEIHTGLLKYRVNNGRAQFFLRLGATVFAQLRVRRRIDTFYRWMDSHLEIKVVQAISPMLLLDPREPMSFQVLTSKAISRADLLNSQIRISQLNVTPFYQISTLDVKTAIDNGVAFSVHIFPPGQYASVGADMCFELGDPTSPEYRTCTICLRDYLQQDSPEFSQGNLITIWYREEANKMELAFTAGDFDSPP